MRKMLKGRFDSMAVESEETAVASLPEGVERREGTFKITVNVEDEETGKKVEKYKSDAEPFSYLFCTNFPSALRLNGAVLTDDQVSFLSEVLSQGNEKEKESTGKAVASILKTINDDLEDSAAKNQYQKILNLHKPLTDENIFNAHARVVRNIMKTANVSDESAISTLKSVNLLPADYTVEKFRENKSKV